MAKIIEAAQLTLEDKVYLKKDYFGWRVVQPIKNDDGSYNWLNLLVGGARNGLFLLGILLILGFLMWSHYHDIQAIQDNYGKIATNPLGWCRDICSGDSNAYDIPALRDVNITKLGEFLED